MGYEIICPLCLARFPANDVVFRHNDVGLRANGGNPEALRGPDAYLQAYNTRHVINHATDRLLRVVDPAFVPERARRYEDGLLTGVRSRGYLLEDRLCPFCHNKLPVNAGRLPMQLMSIIGYTHSGKTTFEAAMIQQLRQNGFSCVDNTLDEYGNPDETVQQNINILSYGDPARFEAPQVQGSKSWHSTEGYHGPYVFALGAPRAAGSTLLTFYDLPGEHFRSHPELISRNAAYIGSAQTCLLFIDLNDIASVSFVINMVLTRFGNDMKRNGISMALVLYKADQLLDVIHGNYTIPVPQQLSGGAPLDMARLDTDSTSIRRFIAERDFNIQTAYTTVCHEIGEANIRFFIAQAFDEDGHFAPQGCDLPILWSLARQGLYPTVKK